jgi:hypothetical protein
MRFYLKTKPKQKELGAKRSGGALAYHALGPEFKPQYCHK